jgi:hypothetical protein
MIYFKRYFPPIENVEIIARRFSIRDLERLRRDYGGRNWRKLKGEADVELADGSVRLAELHWYECHGIGKREVKIKQLLD